MLPKIEFALSKVPIMVVDDDAMMCRLVRDMLIVIGFKDITVAKNGANGIDEVMRREFDLIICDWKMAPMDGIAFTKKIRETLPPPKRFTPIIMLTGRGERKDVEIARDAGITEYMIKPFTAQHLFDRIKIVVDKPRQFVIAKEYRGPDRRRKSDPAKSKQDRRKRPHSYDD